MLPHTNVLRVAWCLAVFAAVLAAPAAGQIFPLSPNWQSADTPYSTGADLVDLNRDGWLDLVVSNGNDMRRERNAVYYNDGSGHFPLSPSWLSSDQKYHGHLSVADVNGDGWQDVAVALLVPEGASAAKLYLNNHGMLSSLPVWNSSVHEPAFGVAFGDMNNDGRPDLAIATGWAYGAPNLYHNYVYLNVGGTLAATPSWTSADTWDYQGVCWVDLDNDGWLDLAYAASNTVSRCYRNLGGMLETTASWVAADGAPNHDAIMFTAGDVTGDGALDLVLADNSQLGGTGCFRLYEGQTSGLPETSASWAYNEGYCSAVALADLDCDGWLDLATGAWWDYTRIFLNGGGFLPGTHSWRSNPQTVVEKIVFGDVNKDGLRTLTQVWSGPQTRRLFYLPHAPVQEIVAVTVDGELLGPANFTCGREHGWVTVDRDPASELRIEYTVSSRMEMAITNWDDDVGNYLYYNQRQVDGDANCDGQAGFGDISPFVLLLTGGYETQFPDCDGETYCDLDGSGDVDFGDINPFVLLLAGG